MNFVYENFFLIQIYYLNKILYYKRNLVYSTNVFINAFLSYFYLTFDLVFTEIKIRFINELR